MGSCFCCPASAVDTSLLRAAQQASDSGGLELHDAAGAAVRLSDDDWKIRLKAADLAAKLDQGALAANAAALAEALHAETHWRVRSSLLAALGKLEPAALAPHAPALVDQLRGSHETVRRAASKALLRLDAAILEACAPAIAEPLRDPEAATPVRLVAMDTLAALPAWALSAHAPALLAQLEANGCEETAARVLCALEPPTLATLAPALVPLMGHEDEGIACSATRVVMSCPAVIAAARPHVQRTLQDRHADAVARRTALEVMARLPHGELEPLAALAVAALSDDDADVRWAAASSLGQLRQTAALASHAVRVAALLEHEDESVRRCAVVTLGHLAPVDLEPHEAALRARLDDESDAVRDAAHHALSPDEEGTPPSSDVDED